MDDLKKRKKTRIYLIVCSSIFGILLLPAVPMIIASAMMFDSPGSTDSTPTWVIFGAIIVYPFITIVAIITAWVLYILKKHMAAIIAITLPLVDIFIGILAMLYLIIFCNGTFAC